MLFVSLHPLQYDEKAPDGIHNYDGPCRQFQNPTSPAWGSGTGGLVEAPPERRPGLLQLERALSLKFL